MFWASIISISLQLAVAAPQTALPGNTNSSNTWKQASYESKSSYDLAAEKHLLDLANADRVRAGLSPLKMDAGLARAARAHAAEMASEKQLSHQFSGEAALNQRIAAASTIHLERM